MKVAADHELALLVLCVIWVLPAPAHGTEQTGTPSWWESRDEREAFLSKASVVTDAPTEGRLSWRATLDDGTRRHDASVVTENGSGPTRRTYKFNVAAYELDRLLGLNLVLPSVERRTAHWASSFLSLSIGRFNERPRRRMSAHRSPARRTRSGMFRTVNVRGLTSLRSTSSHVHGAETGAAARARTVYAAANVALYPFRPVST
jgi:hypothetical protein